MPERRPDSHHCGSNSTGWLIDPHPEEYGVEVDGEVCFDYGDYDDYGDGRCDYILPITMTRYKISKVKFVTYTQWCKISKDKFVTYTEWSK